MIVSKCPLRVSLVGGSSDLDSFLKVHPYGSVISFPCNLYTYITLTKRFDGMYRINYTKTETVVDPKNIQNDIAREAILHFNLEPCTIAFNADIPSSGSGLASSSSYMIALISAIDRYLDLKMNVKVICEKALELERKFNPLTGYQDPYGCGIGGLKRLHFSSSKSIVDVTYEPIQSEVLNEASMWLVPSNISFRNSHNVLSTLNVDKIANLVFDVSSLYANLDTPDRFFEIFNKSWKHKQETSIEIAPRGLLELEEKLRDKDCLGIKLCGAGAGGYFLVLNNKKKWKEVPTAIKIDIDRIGVVNWKI